LKCVGQNDTYALDSVVIDCKRLGCAAKYFIDSALHTDFSLTPKLHLPHSILSYMWVT
jgi:hypothetical protein